MVINWAIGNSIHAGLPGTVCKHLQRFQLAVNVRQHLQGRYVQKAGGGAQQLQGAGACVVHSGVLALVGAAGHPPF